MAWVRLNDNFYDHPKFDDVDNAAVGLWAKGLSYCNSQLTDGFIKTGRVFALRGTIEDAEALVAAGLWTKVEGGYQFHDYLDYQPSRESTMEKRAAEAERQREGYARRKAKKDAESGAPQKPQETVQTTAEAQEAPTPQPVREDVERVCNHLADRIERLTGKRPGISQGWRNAARLLIDADERDPELIIRVIDWVAKDDFWQGNILSMPTLRKQFEKVMLKSGAHKKTPTVSRNQMNWS